MNRRPKYKLGILGILAVGILVVVVEVNDSRLREMVYSWWLPNSAEWMGLNITAADPLMFIHRPDGSLLVTTQPGRAGEKMPSVLWFHETSTGESDSFQSWWTTCPAMAACQRSQQSYGPVQLDCVVISRAPGGVAQPEMISRCPIPSLAAEIRYAGTRAEYPLFRQVRIAGLRSAQGAGTSRQAR